MSILTDLSADGGARQETVNEAVAKRLKELAVGLKEFAAPEKNGATDNKQ
jgi:hypothetical protein